MASVARPHPTPFHRVAAACGLLAFCLLGFAACEGLVLASGCGSASQRISDGAHAVIEAAHDTRTELAAATLTGEVGPTAEPHIANADANQVKILDAAATVQAAVPGVVDKVWVGWGVIRWGFIALAIVGVCFLLWYTGIGMIVKRALWAIGWLIPKPARVAAELDQDAYDATGGVGLVRAAVAGKRASSPAYDAAWAKARKRKRAKAIARLDAGGGVSIAAVQSSAAPASSAPRAASGMLGGST